MKKLLPVIVVVVIALGLWFFISSRIENESKPTTASQNTNVNPASDQANAKSDSAQNTNSDAETATDETEGGEGLAPTDDRPAAERYKSAEEALAAIKAGAADYDDLILDQFTEPGPNCSWCDGFYASVKDLMLSPDTKSEQRSYFAEVLAISGKVENVKAVVDAITGAKSQEEADVFAEALELTVGKDDVVKFLGEQLNQGNETLKEASVAAITNQGSKLAIETLYAHTVEKGDPDGYYSMGIGLGEVVPDEEALPYLQELAMKRDQYSHLAIKGMLNSGIDGVKMVMDVLSNSKNPEFDKEMLKGAKDHVSYDEDVVNYLRQVAESGKNNEAVAFAKDVLADFDQAQKEAEQDQAEEGQDTPPEMPPMSMAQ